VSSKYCVKGGVKDALLNLQNLEDGKALHPVFRLRLAWQYELDFLYDSAIRDVLSLPFAELTVEDIQDLEPRLLTILLAIRDRCHRHRMELVPYVPNATHDATCTDNKQCEKDWRIAYSMSMLLFTHSRKYYTGREVFHKLSTLEIPSLLKICRRLTFTTLEVNRVLWREEVIIEKGHEAIRNVLLSQRPVTPRPEPRFIDIGASAAEQYQF